MSSLAELTGERFGRLCVMQRAPNIGPHTAWHCDCECGAATVVRAQSLLRGETTSCGCVRAEKMRAVQTRHGMYGTRTYHSFRAMLFRCFDTKCPAWKDYGGRGITVCDQWRTFEGFFAEMGERPTGKSLDRWPDNNGNYEPGNCRWATPTEQARNKRNSRKEGKQ